ncbi:MAG: exodeoxyribonuclease VII small subunit [Muribaculaceae bacterium]|nr:exodeoxyribonuclease VII small subunit [Muribaculaceae bacterium]MDE6196253.1 exodeoxyribonuclease VII small subunit [Muribaculaceae bacterium]
MANKESELTYSQALAELESILASLRSDSCDIDTLTERTRRAATLLAECRRRLTLTEEELSKVLADLDSTLEC